MLILNKLKSSKSVKNSLWMIGEKTLRLIVGVFVSGLLARHLGPEIFGQLNYSIALLSVATVLSTLGLNRIFVRTIISCEQQEKEFIVSTVFFLRFLVSIVIWSAGSFISYLFLHSEWFYISVVLFSLLFCSGDVIELYQQGISDVKGMSLNRSISFFVSSAVRISLVYFSVDVFWFFFGVTFEYFFVSFLAALFYKSKHKTNLYNINLFKFKVAKELLAESWPEIIAGFGAMLFMRMDQIMLKNLIGDASVGIYSAATKISEAWYFIPTAIVAATFPSIVKEKDISHNNYINKIELLMATLVSLSLIVAIIVTLSSQYIISVIYGDNYHESADILSLHAWCGLFLCLGIASGSWLAAEKKLKYNLYRNIIGLLVNFILNIYLIPLMGAKGAAISTLVGLVVAFFISDLLFRPLRVIFFSKIKAILVFPIFLKKVKL